MEEQTEYKDSTLQEKVKEETEKVICDVIENGITNSNIDFLGKVVDIHKDMSNEEYWKIKEEKYMRYSRGYGRDSYNDDSYGRRRRDSRGRYRGHHPVDEMYNRYEEYSDGKEEYMRGNYGAKEDTLKSLEYMLESAVDFFEMLKDESSSQEEMNLIREYSRKISDM